MFCVSPFRVHWRWRRARSASCPNHSKRNIVNAIRQSSSSECARWWMLVVPLINFITGFGWACFGICIAAFMKAMENFSYVTSGVITPIPRVRSRKIGCWPIRVADCTCGLSQLM